MKWKIIIIMLMLTLVTSGCSYRQHLIEKADTILATGDLEAARTVVDDLVEYAPKHSKGHVYLGFIHLYEDRPEEALAEFQLALQYNKEPDLEYLGLGQAYLLMGQTEKAREHLEKARSVSSFPATDYLLGFIYLDQGDSSKARRMLKDASEVYPDRGELWGALGRLALEHLQTLDAVQAYQLAYVYGIRQYDIYSGLAESYYQLGNYRQAVAVTEQALTEEHITEQEKEQLQLKLAQYNVNQNPYKAIESFEAILAKDPYKPEVLLMLGQLYHQQGLYQKSLDTFAVFLKKYPPLAPVLHLMSASHLALGNAKLAEKYLQDAIHVKPEALSYYLELINLYHKEGRTGDAVTVYEKALKVAPEDDELLNNLIAILFEMKKYERALPYLERAIQVSPQNMKMYLLKAEVHFFLKQTEEEEATYQTILMHNPENVTALLNLAQIYRETKRYDDAMTLYKRGQAKSPDDSRFDRNIGALYVVQGQYELGREWLTKALTKDPNDYEAYRFLGDSYFGQDQYREAIKQYEMSLSIDPEYHQAMYPLAKAYFYTYDYVKAKDYFTRYQKRFPLNEGCKFYLPRIEWLLNQRTPNIKIEPAKP